MSKSSKFPGEFEAHPDVDELYVVDGMPFTEEAEAENFARHSGKKIEVVKRPAPAKPKKETAAAKKKREAAEAATAAAEKAAKEAAEATKTAGDTPQE